MINFNVPVYALKFWSISWGHPFLCPYFLLEEQAIFIRVCVFLWPLPRVTEAFMDGPVTVICMRHKTDIISGKGLPKTSNILKTGNIKHIKSGKTLVGALLFRGRTNSRICSIYIPCIYQMARKYNADVM